MVQYSIIKFNMDVLFSVLKDMSPYKRKLVNAKLLYLGDHFLYFLFCPGKLCDSVNRGGSGYNFFFWKLSKLEFSRK